MKNTIIVDIDTERDNPIEISKSQTKDLPKNEGEAKEMIILDMGCLVEGLSQLIHAADQSGYKSSEDSLEDCISQLRNNFKVASEEEE